MFKVRGTGRWEAEPNAVPGVGHGHKKGVRCGTPRGDQELLAQLVTPKVVLRARMGI